MEIPSVGTERTATPRQILATLQGALYLPGGKAIDGSQSRDPANTGDVDVLRAGLVMGLRENNNLYAPSILGTLTVAGTAAGATITVASAVGTELDRRIAAGGLFKVVGPPTVGGTVAVLNTLSYSGQVAGVITLAANVAVAEVQTSTLDALMTAGTFTMTYKGYTTAAIAYNATVAQIQAALLLLPSVNAGDITMQAAHEPDTELTCTWTFANTLGNVPMLDIDISLATGPTSCTFAETTPGELVGAATLGADAAIGSLLMAADGSETPLALLGNQEGVKVTDIDGNNIDVQSSRLVCAGIIDASQIINYSVESSTRAWLKTQLNAAARGAGFKFDDDFGW